MEQPPAEGVRKLGNGRQSPTSPLKLFGQAKKKINDIYVEINTYIDESQAFLDGMYNTYNPPNTRLSASVALMMAHRLWRWSNINTPAECLMFAGNIVQPVSLK